MKKKIFNDYVTEVSKLFDVPEDDIFSKSRSADVVAARHMLLYLCNTRGMSIGNIKEFLAERGLKMAHSPILYGVRAMTRKLRNDPDYRYAAKKIQSSIKI